MDDNIRHKKLLKFRDFVNRIKPMTPNVMRQKAATPPSQLTPDLHSFGTDVGDISTLPWDDSLPPPKPVDDESGPVGSSIFDNPYAFKGVTQEILYWKQ